MRVKQLIERAGKGKREYQKAVKLEKPQAETMTPIEAAANAD